MDECLSHEILGRIIDLATVSSRGTLDGKDIPALSSCMLVSRRWREVMLHSAFLWTYLKLCIRSDATRESAAKLFEAGRVWYRRAGTAPLSLFLIANPRATRAITPLIVEFVHELVGQWSSLRVHAPQVIAMRIFCVKDGGRASPRLVWENTVNLNIDTLAGIKASPLRMQPSPFDTRSGANFPSPIPNLHTLKLSHGDFLRDLGTIAWTKLKNLELRNIKPGSHLSWHLEHLGRAADLEVFFIGFEPRPDAHSRPVADVVGEDLRRVVVLPKLKHLYIQGVRFLPRGLVLLQQLRVPVLEHLHYALGDDHLGPVNTDEGILAVAELLNRSACGASFKELEIQPLSSYGGVPPSSETMRALFDATPSLTRLVFPCDTISPDIAIASLSYLPPCVRRVTIMLHSPYDLLATFKSVCEFVEQRRVRRPQDSLVHVDIVVKIASVWGALGNSMEVEMRSCCRTIEGCMVESLSERDFYSDPARC